MDVISQLQKQANAMASIVFNTFGTLQRDAPAVRISPNYPEPPPNPADQDATANVADQAKELSSLLMKASDQFNLLVEALPVSKESEEAELKRIAELQAENDAIGQELQRQLEAAENEKKQVRDLFSQTTFKCLNLRKVE